MATGSGTGPSSSPAAVHRRPVRHVIAAVMVGAIAAACAGDPGADDRASPTPLPTLRTATPVRLETDGPEGPLATAPDPDAAYGQLAASIPFSLAGRCTRGEADLGSSARLDCAVPGANGVRSLSYRLYDGNAALDRAWARLIDGLPGSVANGPGCGEGPGIRRTGTGATACWLEGGDAVSAWKQELAFVIARAERADADWAALERFRLQAGPVTP